MNTQPISKKIRFDGTYDVNSIFLTIQGEGPFTGERAVFIRLAGCNLQCPMCDTEYTKSEAFSIGAITHEVTTMLHPRMCLQAPLVVITGGEPFRQDLTQLIRALIDVGYIVQIETNGTLPAPKGIVFHQNAFPRRSGAYIVCAPKTGAVHRSIEMFACAYKYVIDCESVEADLLPIAVLEHSVAKHVARPPTDRSIPIYIQPADTGNIERNAHNLKLAIRSCMTKGYILQLQVHKIIGVE